MDVELFTPRLLGGTTDENGYATSGQWHIHDDLIIEVSELANIEPLANKYMFHHKFSHLANKLDVLSVLRKWHEDHTIEQLDDMKDDMESEVHFAVIGHE